MMNWIAMLAGCLLLLCGCSDKPRATDGKKAATPTANREHAEEPVKFSADDQEMNAAIAKAKAGLPEFIAQLAHPKPGQEMFGIKATFVADGGQKEHMWVALGAYHGDRLRGILINTPMFIKGLSEGDPVEIRQSQVIDWFYHQDGKMVGAFTEAVAEKRMQK